MTNLQSEFNELKVLIGKQFEMENNLIALVNREKEVAIFWRRAFSTAQDDSDRKHYLLEEIHEVIKKEELICPSCEVLCCSDDCKLAEEVK